MTEREKLQTKAFISANRIADLQSQLEAANRQLRELQERLTLSDAERAILAGEGDGCIRVGDMTRIVNRVFGGLERKAG